MRSITSLFLTLTTFKKTFFDINNKKIEINQEMSIIDGESNSKAIILEDFDGIHIVNFWASWCGPCIEEISELNRFQQEILTENLNVSLIGINIFDKKKDAIEFYLKYKPFFKTVFDKKKYNIC